MGTGKKKKTGGGITYLVATNILKCFIVTILQLFKKNLSHCLPYIIS